MQSNAILLTPPAPAPGAALPITILSAGAGSGKTYRLTADMVERLRSDVRATGIVATTFTQKSAAELQERVRVRLLESGLNEAANELGSALIGTVHSIGVRLLQRFAFEAGVSPLVEIIAEHDGQRMFNESLSQVLSPARIEDLNRLSENLGLTKSKMGDPYDWRRQIRELTDVARANNFSREVLAESKRRSWESFEQLLPPEETATDLQWQNRLIFHLEQAVAALDAQTADDTKLTREAGETLRSLQHRYQTRGDLHWYEWVQIAKVKVGAKSRDLVEDLRQFALSHDAHPRFRQDIKAFIELMFDLAADALGEFERYKQQRGLIDYTDMETYVSRLLREESVRDTLRDEIDLLLVDEFQDTSPMQLDIFLQLSRLAKHSIWVGDPKQSIYGFRGAEPALMQAIVRATGGVQEENILKKSWRSRPDLVYAVNAIFTRAFPDLPPEQITLEPAAPPDPPMRGGEASSAGPPGMLERSPSPPLMGGSGGAGGSGASALIHWHFRSDLDERKVPGQPWLDNCIADQIRILLERGVAVYNKGWETTRPLRPGDIAVLCRSNDGCARMAEALHKAGLRASIARTGLLETAECKLVLAALKYLLSPSDALSTAEILLLTGAQNLEQLVDDRLEWLHRLQQGESMSNWAATNPFIRQINALRSRTADFSASEILVLLLDELDLRRVVARFGNAAQRLDNVDRLRRLALDYESACNRLHTAASIGGFLLWLDALAREGQDWQGSGESPDAVKVLTYHKSKGLEFPVTVCHHLDRPVKEKVWGLNLVSETDTPDLDNILGGRWLRFWVNPYGDQVRGTRLEESLRRSEAFAQAQRQAVEEEARLLYVGLTRARDYLIFPTTAKGTPWLNRVFNHGDESIPTLDPHSDETPFYRDDRPLYCQTELLIKPRDFPEAAPEEGVLEFHAERRGRRPQKPLPYLVDIHSDPPGFRFQPGRPEVFNHALEFKGRYAPALGKALQALVGAAPGSPAGQREAARRQVAFRQLAEQVTPEALVHQAEAIGQFLQQRFQPERIMGKYPLEAFYGERLVQAEADIWLETDDRIVVLQFAGYADGMKKWKHHAQSCAPVLGWMQWIVRQQFPGKAFEGWALFGVEGQAVRVVFSTSEVPR